MAFPTENSLNLFHWVSSHLLTCTSFLWHAPICPMSFSVWSSCGHICHSLYLGGFVQELDLCGMFLPLRSTNTSCSERWIWCHVKPTKPYHNMKVHCYFVLSLFGIRFILAIQYLWWHFTALYWTLPPWRVMLSKFACVNCLYCFLW